MVTADNLYFVTALYMVRIIAILQKKWLSIAVLLQFIAHVCKRDKTDTAEQSYCNVEILQPKTLNQSLS